MWSPYLQPYLQDKPGSASPESSTMPYCPQYACQMKNKQMAKTQITAKMKILM